jgi:hypothetical protein
MSDFDPSEPVEEMAERMVCFAKHKPLEDAPGSYVKVRLNP